MHLFTFSNAWASYRMLPRLMITLGRKGDMPGLCIVLLPKSSLVDRRWLTKTPWPSIGTTKTISLWAGGFSMQMARMKGVWQDGTKRHKKLLSLQQLKSRFRQCWAVHMHILSIKSLLRQHQLVPKTQSS